MSPVQTDPFPDFINNVDVADGDKVDARFLKLYQLQDPAQIGIDFSNTKPGPALLATQQTWQTIALTGFAGGTTLSYYKDSLGNVHFRGEALTAASPGAGSTLCTLPAGYRPGVTIYLPLVITNAQGTSTLSIDTAGVVKTISALGANPWSFGACHFRAEN